jgi:ArsR family transcriptional regulator, lead/cadmium/zinc/bismuth-responsive transcriptional repressor
MKTCLTKRQLDARPQLSSDHALALEAIFKMLASGTRLRILHALVCSDELCVGDLAEQIEMSPQAVSNQLQRLSDRGIVESRREGLLMLYRVVDPCVVALLDHGWCLAEDANERVSKRNLFQKDAS